MGNKVYIGVVLLLWGSSMTWLVGSKILPPFLHGEPPKTAIKSGEPVCWKVCVGQQHIGWAVSQAVPGAEGTTELHSRVKLEQVPLSRMAPRWMATVIDNIGPLQLDMRSRTTLDSLGNLSQFDVSVELNDLPSAILMRGVIEEGFIRLRLQYGEVVHRMNYPWPEHAMLGSKLTPDDKLLSVYPGRRWQKEIYNPFGGPQGAIEMIEAEVTGEESILVDEEVIPTRRIEYRSLDSTGVSADDRRRSTVWVNMEGSVVREEIVLMDVMLRFERQSPERAKRKAEQLLELDQYATLSTPEPLPSPEMRE
ncbi:hypothetical protein [Aeoliella mucimassa]|uniref:Uncharacterized protein n=1 Tax=Aeoliella mucimassa TaxID=2527972 RepID=A0A518AP17_9BACT|nr:hypothetical protein [Aeoliella mucimassa]QDU56465.1 hypothetical protein Pan181_26740 [Aeoliella mucimassa]